MLSQMQDALSTNLPRDGTKEPPKKRARSQSPVQVEDLKPTEASKAIYHDPDFYFEDGSTVILVEHVLFKV